MVRDGRVTPTSMILAEGATKWVAAGAVTNLFPPPTTVGPSQPIVEPQQAPAESGETTAPPSAVDEEGTPIPEIPGFDILGVLGRGGMGVVYRARQVKLKRVVALKMILAGSHAGPEQLARFRTEAEAVARLQDPHIVQIHEIGEHAGAPYCALEFVAGGSLAQKLGGAPQPPRAAAETVRTLARAMHAAHRHGILHRDLKPANILLADDGTPKITDFGLAKRLDDDLGQTRTGAVMGTPSYMSPEQGAGRIHDLGPATDVYALGAILYEMLTGRPPFRGETPLDTIIQVMSDEPVPPSRLQPKVPADLETVCLKCLEKERGKRYATAEALAEDLDRFLDGRPIVARPVSFLGRGVKWAKRRPTVAGLLAAVVAVTVLGFAGVSWQWRGAVRAQKVAERATRKAEDALEETQQQLYFNRVALAHREYQAKHVGRTLQLLEECPAERRGWEWHYLQRACHGESRRFPDHTAGVIHAVYSPDGSLVASAGMDHVVRLSDATTGRQIRVLPGHTDDVNHVAFDPSGRRLATASKDGTARIWDVRSGAERRVYREHSGPVYQVAFTPDGKWLVSAGGDVHLWDPDTGHREFRFPSEATSNHALTISGDGRWLATGGFTPLVEIWDLRTRQLAGRIKETRPIFGLALNADGTRLAVSTSSIFIQTYEVPSGKLLLTLRGHTSTAASVAFSPDGTHIVSGGYDQTVMVWDLRPGQQAQVIRGHTEAINGVGFHPHGQRVLSASSDGTVREWKVGIDPEGVTLARRQVYTLAAHPDGRRLAVFAEQPTLAILDIPSGAARILDGRTMIPSSGGVTFTPDGRYLATNVTGPGRDQIFFWDVAAGTMERTITLEREQGDAMDITFSPDSHYLAAATRTFGPGKRDLDARHPANIVVWEIATGKVVQVLRGHSAAVNCVAYSRDGRLLASGSDDNTIRIWETRDGTCRHVLEGHTHKITRVAFRGDGAILASGSADRTVRTWDVAAGQPLRVLRGHTYWVTGIAFNRDGTRLATCSNDRTVKLWEPESGTEVLTLTRHLNEVKAVTFSSDGRWLISSGDDGLIQCLDGAPKSSPE
jgi:WD40 repeat protein